MFLLLERPEKLLLYLIKILFIYSFSILDANYASFFQSYFQRLWNAQDCVGNTSFSYATPKLRLRCLPPRGFSICAFAFPSNFFKGRTCNCACNPRLRFFHHLQFTTLFYIAPSPPFFLPHNLYALPAPLSCLPKLTLIVTALRPPLLSEFFILPTPACMVHTARPQQVRQVKIGNNNSKTNTDNSYWFSKVRPVLTMGVSWSTVSECLGDFSGGTQSRYGRVHPSRRVEQPTSTSPSPASRERHLRQRCVTEDKLALSTIASPGAAIAPPPPPLVPDSTAVYNLLEDESEDVCPTCLETYATDNPKIETTCGHAFHLQCIVAWETRSGSKFCPICAKLMDYVEADQLHSA